MKALHIFFLLLLSIGVATPVAASPRRAAAVWPGIGGVSDVLLNVKVAAPAAAVAWPWDSEQPGSFLVFPYFRTGTVMTTDQGKLPRTEFEISVLCPSGETCLDHQKVYLHAEWVCGSDDESFPDLCDGRDFFIETTVNATVYFSPQPATDMVNLGPNATVISALPPCNEGELLVWVVDDKTDANPIKFDGLIGDEVTHSNEGSSGKAPAGEYNAIAIQASENLSTGDALPQLDATTHAVAFDGNGYQQVTGTIFGSFRYPGPTYAVPVPAPGTALVQTGRIETQLILLTLDMTVGQNNPPTHVELSFGNEAEVLSSAHTNFVCRGKVRLDHLGLNNTGQRKGLIQSEPAQRVAPPTTATSPVTLLGLIRTQEVDYNTGYVLNEYYSLLSHDVNANAVPTTTFTP